MMDLCIVIIGGDGGNGSVSPKRRCALPVHREHVCLYHWLALDGKRKKEEHDVQQTATQ